jgi:hypothetical protein
VDPADIKRRKPHPSEDRYFFENPHVGGMAAEDNADILNPYSKLSEEELRAVEMNERARIMMRANKDLRPAFALTPEQMKAFAQYGSDDDRRATVAARVMTNDPSAGRPTQDQQVFADMLRKRMGL